MLAEGCSSWLFHSGACVVTYANKEPYAPYHVALLTDAAHACIITDHRTSNFCCGGCRAIHCIANTIMLLGSQTLTLWVCAFLQVIVDAIDPSVIVSNCATKTFDFGSIKESELTDITIPLQLQVGMSASLIHPTHGSNGHV